MAPAATAKNAPFSDGFVTQGCGSVSNSAVVETIAVRGKHAEMDAANPVAIQHLGWMHHRIHRGGMPWLRLPDAMQAWGLKMPVFKLEMPASCRI